MQGLSGVCAHRNHSHDVPQEHHLKEIVSLRHGRSGVQQPAACGRARLLCERGGVRSCTCFAKSASVAEGVHFDLCSSRSGSSSRSSRVASPNTGHAGRNERRQRTPQPELMHRDPAPQAEGRVGPLYAGMLTLLSHKLLHVVRIYALLRARRVCVRALAIPYTNRRVADFYVVVKIPIHRFRVSVGRNFGRRVQCYSVVGYWVRKLGCTSISHRPLKPTSTATPVAAPVGEINRLMCSAAAAPGPAAAARPDAAACPRICRSATGPVTLLHGLRARGG
jgi:hypothetical protein